MITMTRQASPFDGVNLTHSTASADEDSMPWKNQTLHDADWLDRIREQIQNLDRHQQNWDSYGAAPVCPKSIHDALGVAERIAKYPSIQAPSISATPDGIVALGWDVGDWSLDAEIGPNRQILYACLDERDGEHDHEGFFNDWWHFAEFLSDTFLSFRKK